MEDSIVLDEASQRMMLPFKVDQYKIYLLFLLLASLFSQRVQMMLDLRCAACPRTPSAGSNYDAGNEAYSTGHCYAFAVGNNAPSTADAVSTDAADSIAYGNSTGYCDASTACCDAWSASPFP